MSNTQRQPNPTQRLRWLSQQLSVDPRKLADRVQKAQCALCLKPLPYTRKYFDHHACCADCEAGLEASVARVLNELENYL